MGKTKGFIRGKALSVEGHTHTIAQITNLQNTLNRKANTSHNHTTSQITGLEAYIKSLIEQTVSSGFSVEYRMGYKNGNTDIVTFSRIPVIVIFGFGGTSHNMSFGITPGESYSGQGISCNLSGTVLSVTSSSSSIAAGYAFYS